MSSMIEKRIENLRRKLAEKKIDTLMVTIEENRRYLSGFTGEDGGFDESAGTLFISDSHLVLATDSRYNLQAEMESPLYRIVCYKEGLFKELPGILRSVGAKNLGFESIRLSQYQYQEICETLKKENLQTVLKPVRDLVESFRFVKDEEEIDATKAALAIAEKAYVTVAGSIREGMTERDVAWAMEKAMREQGADGLSFPTIIAVGKNSALPHAIPGNNMIAKGQPVLFDWGARLRGYCSDTSRTIILGPPDDRFKKVFDVVQQAQAMAIDVIRAGVSSKAVDAVARSHIEKSGFEGKFGHGLGHGTGLAIHENPRLSPLKDTTLEAGMIVTVEPGVYLPEWGGVRIENQVVVRDDGAEVLNGLDIDYHAPK